MDKLDIYAMLTKQADELFPDDLDCLLSELELGGYPSEYIKKCKSLINEIKKKYLAKGVSGFTVETDGDAIDQMQIHNPNKIISPDDINESALADIINNIKQIREHSNNGKDVFNYIDSCTNINGKFIEEHFELFKLEELSLFLKKYDFSEEFLEKHFSVLSHKEISKYQMFSEEFFMKHFMHLDIKETFKNKKNPWIIKENRTQKFDMFLRLKGIN